MPEAIERDAPAARRSAQSPVAVETAVGNTVDHRARMIRLLRGQGLLAVLVVLVVWMSLASPYFFNPGNFLTIAAAVATLGIIAVPQTFLVISGGIDISVGSVVAFSGIVLGVAVGAGVNIWVAVVLGLLSAAAIGAVNGLITVKLQVNPLVATLGTLSIFAGLAFVVSERQMLIINDAAFMALGTGQLGPLPYAVVLFLVWFAVGLFVEKFTTTGTSIYAIGGNAEAARLSGLRVDGTRFLLYVITSLSAGVAGVIIVARLSATSANVGNPFLLSVVTAVVLGGASLAGGRGTLVGTLLAVAILGVLQNGFALLQYSSFAQQIVLGLLLIGAVLLDQTARKWEAA